MRSTLRAKTLLKLALLASIVGCRGAGPSDPGGKYYAFVDDKRPTAATFARDDDIPVAELDLKPDHTWTMDVVMAERPFTGVWSRKGDLLNLDIAGSKGDDSLWSFRIVGGRELHPVGTAPGDKGMETTFYKMSADWEKSFATEAAKEQ